CEQRTEHASAVRRQRRHERERAENRKARMDARRWLNSTFLKVEDVRDGPIEGTIIAVREGERFDRPVIEIEDGSCLSLNQTNLRVMIRRYTDDPDLWLNNPVGFYLGSVPFEGKPTESVLVEPLSPKVEPKPKPKMKSKVKLGEPDLDDEVAF